MKRKQDKKEKKGAYAKDDVLKENDLADLLAQSSVLGGSKIKDRTQTSRMDDDGQLVNNNKNLLQDLLGQRR